MMGERSKTKGVRKVKRWVGVVTAAWLTTTAHAGLFEDDEARKAVLDLRVKVEQNAQASRTGLQDLKAENEQLRASLLQLNSSIDQLKADLAQQRGSNEQLTRALTELQKQQKDQAQKFEDRLRVLEPVKVSVDGLEFQVESAERKMYEEALAQFRNGQFPAAQSAFADFLKRYPNSGYQTVSLFWLGNAQYANKQFRDALTSFQQVVKSNANHPKAPEALLSAANCQAELKDAKGMRKSLEDLKAKYPTSEAGVAAAERLKKLK